jgi:hypothetical protein
VVSFRIQSFQRKHDVLAVLIIFDSRGTENSGPGYKHPGRGADTSENFPIVICCPSVSINLLLGKKRDACEILIFKQKILLYCCNILLP